MPLKFTKRIHMLLRRAQSFFFFLIFPCLWLWTKWLKSFVWVQYCSVASTINIVRNFVNECSPRPLCKPVLIFDAINSTDVNWICANKEESVYISFSRKFASVSFFVGLLFAQNRLKLFIWYLFLSLSPYFHFIYMQPLINIALVKAFKEWVVLVEFMWFSFW